MAQGRAPAGEAADWLTIWQSELSAMAQDRELAEAWMRWVAASGAAASRMVQMAAWTGGTDAAAGHAGAAAPPGAAPIMAAPGGRDAAFEELAKRVAALERECEQRTAGPIDRPGVPGS